MGTMVANFEDTQYRAEAPFNLGVPVVFNLNPGSNITYGCVNIEATVTISGSAAAGTVVGEGGPTNLIRRILVLANKAPANQNGSSRYPNGALVNCTPRSLLRYATIEHQGKYVGELSGSNLGNGANGVYDIYLSIPIFFADPAANLNQVQTSLNMNPIDSQGRPVYSQVQVKIDVAAAIGELFSGNNGDIAVAGMVRWLDKRIKLPVDTVPLKQEDHEVFIQQPQEALVDFGLPNDGAFTQWLIMAQQGQPGLVFSDAILKRLECWGPTVNFKHSWQDMRQAMIDSDFYDPSQSMTGQFFKDWTNGVLTNANPAAGLLTKFAVNNPSGAGLDNLLIYTRRVFGLGQ